MKKTNLLIVIILSILFVGCSKSILKEDNTVFISKKVNNIENEKAEIEEKPISNKDSDSDKDINIKEKVNIKVPFADQAPFKDWGDPYQEACEETSIIMANEYLKGNTTEDLKKEYIKNEIVNMVDYQEVNYGGHFDLDAKESLDLFRDYYDYSGGEIRKISSIDEIKSILSEGSIIIAPTYGQALENTHFTPPGPVYHMLVIKGYDETNFITNDPGIWQGKDFTYSFENLFDSIHDLPDEATGKAGYIKSHPELIKNNIKNIIVISR